MLRALPTWGVRKDAVTEQGFLFILVFVHHLLHSAWFVAGLDTCLSIMKVLHNGLGDSKYRPCPLLQSYVDAGWLGQKVGKGVYQYDQEHQKDAKH